MGCWTEKLKPVLLGFLLLYLISTRTQRIAFVSISFSKNSLLIFIRFEYNAVEKRANALRFESRILLRNGPIFSIRLFFNKIIDIIFSRTKVHKLVFHFPQSFLFHQWPRCTFYFSKFVLDVSFHLILFILWSRHLNIIVDLNSFDLRKCRCSSFSMLYVFSQLKSCLFSLRKFGWFIDSWFL